MQIIIGKIYAFLCNILHWAGPILLVLVLSLGTYSLHQSKNISKLETAKAQIESDFQLCLEDAKAFKKQTLENQKEIVIADSSKKANSIESCQSKLRIQQSKAVKIKPETDLLEQELPDDLIKEIDPSYNPKS